MRFSIVRLFISMGCIAATLGLRQLVLPLLNVGLSLTSTLLVVGAFGALIGLAVGVLIGRPWTSAIVGAIATVVSLAMLMTEDVGGYP